MTETQQHKRRDRVAEKARTETAVHAEPTAADIAYQRIKSAGLRVLFTRDFVRTYSITSTGIRVEMMLGRGEDGKRPYLSKILTWTVLEDSVADPIAVTEEAMRLELTNG